MGRRGESGTAWLLLFHLLPLWRHTIQLVDLDPLYRYRQRRWHKLVRNHLLPTGPRHTSTPQDAPN